jgi:hypothetical protein
MQSHKDLRGVIERIDTLAAEKQLLQDQQKARKAAATAKKMQLEQEKAEKAAQKSLEKEVNNKKKAEEKAAINARVMARKDGAATKRAAKEEAKRLREETAVAKAIAKQAVLNSNKSPKKGKQKQSVVVDLVEEDILAVLTEVKAMSLTRGKLRLP